MTDNEYKLITKTIEEFLKSPQRKQFVKESLKKARKSTDKLLEMMRYKYNEKVFYSGE